MKSILGICSGLVLLVAASVAIGQDRDPQDTGQEQPRRGEGRPEGGRGEGRESRERRPDMMMVLLDKDRDGSLSADEINAAPEALRALDTNDDGVLSSEELRPRRPDRERGGPEGGEGRRDRGMGGFIMRFDSNQDGVVTREEWAAGQDESFARMDKNKDGQIDAEEAASGFGGGRGGPGGRDGRDGGESRERRPRQP